LHLLSRRDNHHPAATAKMAFLILAAFPSRLSRYILDYFEVADASEAPAYAVALRSGVRVVIEDVNAALDFEPHRRVAAATGFRGLQSTPLTDRDSGKLTAIISTYFRDLHRPSHRELQLAELYARQAADVIVCRLVQDQLHESEAWLSAVLNQVPGGVGVFDRVGRLLLRGGPLSRMWDDVIPSRDAVAARRWRGFDVHGRLLTGSEYPGARALRGETVIPGIDFLHTGEDGIETWFRVSAGPFRNTAGEITGGVALMQDVDDQKRYEQRLRESEARLQAAVELVELGRYAWNPQTNELQWDQKLRSMWGLSADAHVDYSVWLDAIHPEDRAAALAAADRCLDPHGDGVYDIEYRVIGVGDGVERWIATRGLTQFVGGKAVSFYGVALDVTNRKQIENALELRVEARTRELEEANRRLVSSMRRREQAEAAVQQLQRLEVIRQ
jgi:PAS domain S-box-containing protein